MEVTYTQTVYASLALAVTISRFLPQHSSLSGIVALFFGLEAVLFSLLFIWRVFLYPFCFSPLRDIPSPPGGSLLNGQFWLIRDLPTGDPQKKWIREVPNNGLIRYLHLFNAERLLLTNPKAIGEVLVTKNYEFEKSSMLRHTIGRILGVGILLAEGDEHRRQRRLLTPAFSYRHIKDLYPMFWSKATECIGLMTEAITSTAKGVEEPNVINAQSWASRVTLDIIGVAGMGHDFEAVQDPNSELSRTYRDLLGSSQTSIGRAVQILFFLAPRLTTLLPFKRNTEIADARLVIRKTCFDLINKKREKLEKGDREKDILSVALESGGFKSDDDIVNQLMTFLAAGHETTASSMAWACYHLCKHPEIQVKLREEVRRNLPSPRSGDGISTSDFDIEKMPYLHAVCNETLRLYPSVPLTTRHAVQDTSICDHFVPKDTLILICPWAVNTSTELWGPDADEFKPERWLTPGQANAGGASSAYAFLSFLHGPRSCIGQGFAKAEFEVLLASWVGRLEMEFAEKDYVLDVGAGITSKPKGGLKVRCKEVEGW